MHAGANSPGYYSRPTPGAQRWQYWCITCSIAVSAVVQKTLEVDGGAMQAAVGAVEVDPTLKPEIPGEPIAPTSPPKR